MLQKRNLTQKLEKIDQILEPFGLAQNVQNKKEELLATIVLAPESSQPVSYADAQT